MSVYEGFKVYGPYFRKDGRQHVILMRRTEKGFERKTVSYPKYLVEVYLNRILEPEETVDHIDGNFSNNSLSNLRVVPRKEHAKSHTECRVQVTKKCIICGTTYTTTNNKRVTCGSKVCIGKCTRNTMSVEAAAVLDKKIEECSKENEYISQRSLIQEIDSVEGANSVNPLVGNTEQGIE